MLAPPIDIHKTLATELYPGEEIVWTDRPPQRPLFGVHALQIPFGFALLAIATGISARIGLPITFRSEIDIPFRVVLIFLGGYFSFVEPILGWRKRRGTGYALTDRRAIIVERDRFLASYFLGPNLEVELISHFKGSQTIRFGTPAKARWLSSHPGKRTSTPARKDQLFDRIQRASQLYDQIRRASSLIGLPFPTDVPFVRRVDPEHQYDAVANAKIDPLEYAQPVRAKLLRGESTLYIGRPPQGILFRPVDWFLVPFAALWTSFSISFVWHSLRFVCPAMFGLLFVWVGLYLLVGRFYYDRRYRQRAWYAVTNLRCLIVEDAPIIETKSMFWNFIQGVARHQDEDGKETLSFELSATGRHETVLNQDITAFGRPQGSCFERIADARTVEELVAQRVLEQTRQSAK